VSKRFCAEREREETQVNKAVQGTGDEVEKKVGMKFDEMTRRGVIKTIQLNTHGS